MIKITKYLMNLRRAARDSTSALPKIWFCAIVSIVQDSQLLREELKATRHVSVHASTTFLSSVLCLSTLAHPGKLPRKALWAVLGLVNSRQGDWRESLECALPPCICWAVRMVRPFVVASVDVM
jgi:hypothetical protein